MPEPFRISEPDTFFTEFPKLPRNLKASSKATDKYICFSLGVGDEDHVWGPYKFTWWLRTVPLSRAVSSFVRLFEELGYEESDHKYQRGVRKVAIFAKNGDVKHVAVQPPDKRGRWHSKMGYNVDILHTLDQITGDVYGEPVKFMRQLNPSRARTVIARLGRVKS